MFWLLIRLKLFRLWMLNFNESCQSFAHKDSKKFFDMKNKFDPKFQRIISKISL